MSNQNAMKSSNRLSLNKETITDLEMPVTRQDDVRGGGECVTRTVPTIKNPPTKTVTINVPPTKG